LSTDFSGYEGSPDRSLAATPVLKKQRMSGRAKFFLILFAVFTVVLPAVLWPQLTDEDLFIGMLRCCVMLVAALMVFSKSKMPVVLGSMVSGLFVAGFLSSLLGDSSTKGVNGLLTLAAAFALAWFGAPLFRKNKIAVSSNQFVYGEQPSEWGRGAGDSIPSSIWLMGLLLNKLVAIPGVFVFHGLKSPGARRLDVEHIATHGNTVYLIDSWSDFPTNYSWRQSSKGRVASSNGDGGDQHTRIADAADRYRAALGQGIHVIPVISVVSGKASIGPQRWSPRGVGLFTADELLGFIGDRAAEALPTQRDHPEVRDIIAASVVSYACVPSLGLTPPVTGAIFKA
jgi:hypothetical protein